MRDQLPGAAGRGGWRERINRGGSVAVEKGFFVRPPSHPGCSSHCLEQIGLCCSLLHKLTENRFVDDLSKLGPSRGRREFGKRDLLHLKEVKLSPL